MRRRCPCQDERLVVEPEAACSYSNRGLLVSADAVSDYATATIRLTLPPAFATVCSGDQAGGSPVAVKNAAGEPRALFVFAASQPVRYLACVVSRLRSGRHPDADAAESRGSARRPPAAARATRADDRRLRHRAPARTRAGAAAARARTSPPCTRASCTTRRTRASRSRCSRATFRAATVPAYFAALNQPLPTSPFSWRDDPASFDNYPGVLPRPRARAPVVGAGRRVEELPRAVAERGVRAVLRGHLRGAAQRRRACSTASSGR